MSIFVVYCSSFLHNRVSSINSGPIKRLKVIGLDIYTLPLTGAGGDQNSSGYNAKTLTGNDTDGAAQVATAQNTKAYFSESALCKSHLGKMWRETR